MGRGPLAELLPVPGHRQSEQAFRDEDPFDWNGRSTGAPHVNGARAADMSYYPDLAAPGAATVGTLAAQAVELGVDGLALLSCRGEEEAQRSEQAARAASPAVTVVRLSWSAQSVSEGFLLDVVLHGLLAPPIGTVRKPFRLRTGTGAG